MQFQGSHQQQQFLIRMSQSLRQVLRTLQLQYAQFSNYCYEQIKQLKLQIKSKDQIIKTLSQTISYFVKSPISQLQHQHNKSPYQCQTPSTQIIVSNRQQIQIAQFKSLEKQYHEDSHSFQPLLIDSKGLKADLQFSTFSNQINRTLQIQNTLQMSREGSSCNLKSLSNLQKIIKSPSLCVAKQFKKKKQNFYIFDSQYIKKIKKLSKDDKQNVKPLIK